MSFGKRLKYFFQNLREKHRFSIRNQHTDREVWYMHISPLNLFAGFIALVLVLFIIVTSIVAYTPVLDLIPGNPGSKTRMMLVNNIMRLDSLERQIVSMQQYSENISLIMSGRNPVTPNLMTGVDTISKSQTETVPRIMEDSLLRAQLEAGGGVYSLDDPTLARRNLRSSLELFAPVQGVIAQKFDPSINHYGVRIATTVNREVMAISDGTVISSAWNPTDGFVLYIQHGNNLLSIYRHNVTALKSTGEPVQSGEVIGYTGSPEPDPSGKNQFEFELWYNGTPVDPESYIAF